MPGSGGDTEDEALVLPLACPSLVGKMSMSAVVMQCGKFHDGGLHRVLGSTKQQHLHRPGEGGIQRRLLGVGSHQF